MKSIELDLIPDLRDLKSFDERAQLLFFLPSPHFVAQSPREKLFPRDPEFDSPHSSL